MSGMNGIFSNKIVKFGAVAATALGVVMSFGSAQAADKWPDGPVQFIVGYGAGGGTDRGARMIAPELEKVLGVPVVVQNLPGAGGQIASQALLREKADGRTILVYNQPDLSMSVILKNAPYKLSDFQVVFTEMNDPRILLVNNDSPIKSFDDFMKMAKEKEGGVTVSVSQGGAQELLGKWLIKKLGANIRLVGYKSGGAAAAAMTGGQVDATLGDDFSRFNIRDKARALFIGSDKQSIRWTEAPLMIDVLKPYGVVPPTPDFLARYGVYVVPSAFKKEQPEHYAILQKALVAATQSDSFRARLKDLGIEDLFKGAPGEVFAETFDKAAAALDEMK